MKSLPFLLESDAQETCIKRARVVTVHNDGSALVATGDRTGPRVYCDVLQTSERSRLRLARGEAVLVLLPLQGAEQERGVILGRVGTSNTPASESTEISDQLVIEAKKNLTLKCGDGSITIRAD